MKKLKECFTILGGDESEQVNRIEFRGSLIKERIDCLMGNKETIGIFEGCVWVPGNVWSIQ